MFNHYVTNRMMAVEFFKHAFWKARMHSTISKLLRNASCLKTFDEVIKNKNFQSIYLGVLEISVENIVGTVGRVNDFDNYFRPLKKHLSNRWINMALLSGGAGWPPIDVYKVGTEFYVIDGHHRTSFARISGMEFVDANVWEVRLVPDNNRNEPLNEQVSVELDWVPVYEQLIPAPIDPCFVAC